MIVTELEHAWFKNVILITDRGYESMKNLEVYIAKNQKVITSVKCGQGEALKAIKSIGLSTGVPEGMTFSKDTNLFYRQYSLDYQVQGNGEHVIKADRMKLNLYFDIRKRADDLARVQMAITTGYHHADGSCPGRLRGRRTRSQGRPGYLQKGE